MCKKNTSLRLLFALTSPLCSFYDCKSIKKMIKTNKNVRKIQKKQKKSNNSPFLVTFIQNLILFVSNCNFMHILTPVMECFCVIFILVHYNSIQKIVQKTHFETLNEAFFVKRKLAKIFYNWYLFSFATC